MSIRRRLALLIDPSLAKVRVTVNPPTVRVMSRIIARHIPDEITATEAPQARTSG